MATMGRIGISVATLAVTLAGLPAPVVAAEQVTCILNETITWSPPLKNQAQSVTFTTHGQLTACNGLSATATYQQTGTYASATCNSVLGSGAGTRVFDWTAPGVESSVFSYIVTGTRTLGTITAIATGPIIAGAYTDSTVRSVAIAPVPDVLACAGDGVPQVFVAGTLTIGI